MSRLIKNVHLVVFFFLVTACVSTPPPSPLSSESVSEAVRKISGSSYRAPDTTDINDVDQRTIKVRDRLLVPIQRVCLSYGEVSERKCEKGFAFTIVEDDDFNASAHGSNSITINSGLIRRTVSEEELAFVLAHEAGHHIANHLNEDAMNSTVGGIVGGLLMGAVTVGVMSALGVECNSNYEDCSWEEDVIEAGVKDGVDMGKGYSIARYSREQEFEADRIASAILRDTRMDIAKVVPLMAYMGKQFGTERFSEFGDSHPSGAERLAAFLQDNQLVNKSYLKRSSRERVRMKVAKKAAVSTGRVSAFRDLKLITSGYSWVDVNDSTGAKVFSEVASPGFEGIVVTSLPATIKVGDPAVTSLSYGGETLDFQPFVESGGITKFVLCPGGTLAAKVSQCSELRAEGVLSRKPAAVEKIPQRVNQVADSSSNLAIATTGYSWVKVNDSTGAGVFSEVASPGFEGIVVTSLPATIKVGDPAVTSLSYGGETLDFQPFVESGGITKFVLCPGGTLAAKVSQCSELRAAMKTERIKNSVASVKKHQSIGRLDHDLGSLAISTTGYGWVDVSNANGKELVSKVSVSGFERVIKASPPLRITVSKVGITKLSYKGKALNAKPFADSDGLAKFVLCADGAVFSDEKDCPQP